VSYKAEAWWYMLIISIFEFPIIKDFYRMNNSWLFFFENFQFFSVSNWVHLNWCHSNCVYKNVKIFSQWLWEMLCYTTIKTFWLHLQPFYVRLRTFWLTDTFMTTLIMGNYTKSFLIDNKINNSCLKGYNFDKTILQFE
jgi:hypothetical protein